MTRNADQRSLGKSLANVARIRRSGPVPDLTAILQELGGVPVGTQAVEALLVMESTLNPSGSIYSQVEEIRLGEVG